MGAPFILRSNGRFIAQLPLSPHLHFYILTFTVILLFCMYSFNHHLFFDDSLPAPSPPIFFGVHCQRIYYSILLSCPEYYTHKIYDPIFVNNISYDESSKLQFCSFPPFPFGGSWNTLYHFTQLHFVYVRNVEVCGIVLHSLEAQL